MQPFTNEKFDLGCTPIAAVAKLRLFEPLHAAL